MTKRSRNRLEVMLTAEVGMEEVAPLGATPREVGEGKEMATEMDQRMRKTKTWWETRRAVAPVGRR